MARIRLEDATPEWLKQFTATEQSAAQIAERFLEVHLGISVGDSYFGMQHITFTTGSTLSAINLLDLIAAEITTKSGNVFRFASLEVDTSDPESYLRNVVTYKAI